MLPRTSTAAPVLAVLAILLLPLAGYVGGYFWLGNYEEFNFGALAVPPRDYMVAARKFPHEWLASAYAPLGRAESWWRGHDVHLSPEPQRPPTNTMPLPLPGEMMPEEKMLEEEAAGPPPRVRIIINEATGQIVL